MYFATTLIATVLAAAGTTTALSAIVPPNNPSSNGEQSYCSDRTECLTYINNVRASQEGLDPIALPANWDALSRPERLYTFMNLERTSRGLDPLTHMVNTYDSQVRTAITNDADPEPPSSIFNGGGGSWNSIWAGGEGMIPLAAMYMWMYYDGPGGNNIDCKSSSDSGCWGHRDNILAADVTQANVGFGFDAKGQEGAAAILFSSSAVPSEGQTVLTWAAEKKHCA